jgi:outer membrane immunogenic protein
MFFSIAPADIYRSGIRMLRAGFCVRLEMKLSHYLMAGVICALPFAANAADLPVKAHAGYAPDPASWTGLYIGADVGFKATESNWTTTGASFTALTSDTSRPTSGNSFRFAGHAGYNYQFAPQWVAGIEGDFGWADKTVTVTGSPAPGTFNFAADSIAVKTGYDASLRGRAGYLLTPMTMVYATGGAAWQRLEAQRNVPVSFCCGPFTTTASTVRTGWTVGGGLEWMMTRNWLLRAEYRYADFGTANFSDTNPAGGVTTYDVSLKTHMANFGASYKF